MSLRTYDVNRLMNNARISLPGALDGAIQLELFNVLNDFFQDTNIWQESLTFGISSANAFGTTIEISPNAGTINRLLYVIDSNKIIKRMSMPQPGHLQVIELTNNSETWTARVAITVSDPVPSTGTMAYLPICPGWILEKYSNGVLSGVLARMLLQPSKPYTNTKLAAVHGSLYRKTVSNARTEARHQNIFDGQRWSFPRSFATGHQRGMG